MLGILAYMFALAIMIDIMRIDVNTVGVNDIVEELISRGVMVNVDLRM